MPPIRAGHDALAYRPAGSSAGRRLLLASAGAVDTIACMSPPETFAEFWSFYVLAHRQRATRIFHTVGTLSGWSLLIAAIILRRPWLIVGAVVVPYAFAWFSHFFVEHNRPATFGHPLWSWVADQKMVAMVLAGKMGREVERCTQDEQRAA